MRAHMPVLEHAVLIRLLLSLSIHYILVSKVGYMAQLDLPLPEVTVEYFSSAWKRFELVAIAKEWNAEKKVKVLLTLLHGKLVDIYITLDEDTKTDLAEVKKALIKRAGLIKDPLVSGRNLWFCRKYKEKP